MSLRWQMCHHLNGLRDAEANCFKCSLPSTFFPYTAGDQYGVVSITYNRCGSRVQVVQPSPFLVRQRTKLDQASSSFVQASVLQNKKKHRGNCASPHLQYAHCSRTRQGGNPAPGLTRATIFELAVIHRRLTPNAVVSVCGGGLHTLKLWCLASPVLKPPIAATFTAH